jgi:hypothetical protein
MAVRSALCVVIPLPPRRSPVLIYVRGWVDPTAIVRLEVLSELKKNNDPIGNRTHELPACSTVPQPATLWSVPLKHARHILSNRFQLLHVKLCGFSYFIISLKHNGLSVSYKRDPCYPLWVTELPFFTALFLFRSFLWGGGLPLFLFPFLMSLNPGNYLLLCLYKLNSAFMGDSLYSYGDTSSLYPAQFDLWRSSSAALGATSHD